jgi:molecular chaperone GrpE
MEEKNIETELEQLKQKNDEYLNGWKRERADFINYKKDEMERINGLVKYANEEIILNFLPILDNVILAEAHLKDEGITQIKKQFLELLKREGIEPIECVGKPFDPNLMEALEGEGETVAEELQMGFTMHGKLIRPAKVKLSK